MALFTSGTGSKKHRHGKRMKLVEKHWAKMPAKHRTEATFLVLAEACGVTEEKAREHFTGLLALMGAGRAE